MLETFDQSRLDAAGPYTISDLLEQGKIVYFPECPVPLPDEMDLARMREDLPDQLKKKNASLGLAFLYIIFKNKRTILSLLPYTKLQ